MSRLSQQQQRRIQEQRQHSEYIARVVAHLGYAVLLDYQGEALLADWRQHLGDIACNDRVSIELTGQQAVIQTVLPRPSAFWKRQGRKKRVLASHIDQVLLVSAVEPEWQENLIDRFRLACHAQGLPLLWFINKCDLAQDDEVLQKRLQPYRDLSVLCGSVHLNQGLEALREALQGRSTLICGQSGVGKSSLIKAFKPEVDVWIQAVSDLSRLGRHTTTNIRLYDLDAETCLIDSAGVRGLNVEDYAYRDALSAFPDLQQLALNCRFHDCSHQQEPDCAVQEALRTGEISLLRYQNFLQISSECKGD